VQDLNDVRPLRRALGKLAALLAAGALHRQHPAGHFAARLLHHVGDAAQETRVLEREEGDRLALPASAPRAPDAVDVAAASGAQSSAQRMRQLAKPLCAQAAGFGKNLTTLCGKS